jgi:hypothetical protein
MSKMQEKSKKSVKMSFIDYYELSEKLKGALRDEIMKALEISQKSFYNKMKDDTWSSLERVKLEEVYHKHIFDLVNNLVA